MNRCRVFEPILLVFWLVGSLSAENTRLGFLHANAISPDGRAVVGCKVTRDGPRAVRWTAKGGAEVLAGNGPASAAAACERGATVVGTHRNRAALWTSAGLRELEIPGSVISWATDVSADGQCVVGTSLSEKHTVGFVWRASAIKRLSLSQPLSASEHTIVTAVSADGQTVVGRTETHRGTAAFLWTEQDGMVVFGSKNSTASDVSGDGRVVVGKRREGEGYRPFRWTRDSGMTDPGHTVPGDAVATGVSNDGLVVVGVCEGASRAIFVWDATRNAARLLALDELSPFQIARATGTSADATKIVGFGRVDKDRDEAFYIDLGTAD